MFVLVLLLSLALNEPPLPAGPLLVVPGQEQVPPTAAPPLVEPLVEPLTALASELAPPETPVLGEALTPPLMPPPLALPLAPVLALLFTLVLLLTLVFVFWFVLLLLVSAPDVDGLALGLDVAFWSVVVPWVPEPALVELDWFVVVV
jgi:hypothetical protein